jgi:hypothetical protein
MLRYTYIACVMSIPFIVNNYERAEMKAGLEQQLSNLEFL